MFHNTLQFSKKSLINNVSTSNVLLNLALYLDTSILPLNTNANSPNLFVPLIGSATLLSFDPEVIYLVCPKNIFDSIKLNL